MRSMPRQGWPQMEEAARGFRGLGFKVLSLDRATPWATGSLAPAKSKAIAPAKSSLGFGLFGV